MISTIFLVAFISAMTPEELRIAKLDVREGMINEPGLSFNSLANDDLVTKHWKTALSSVFLKNKLVMAPELPSANGYASSNYVRYSEAYLLFSNLPPQTSKLSSTWRSTINKETSRLSASSISIFWCRFRTLNKNLMVMAWQIAVYLRALRLLSIRIFTGKIWKVGGPIQSTLNSTARMIRRLNHVRLFILFIFPTECIMAFKRAKLRLSSSTEKGVVTLEIKPEGQNEWTICF